jgi:hypothetical protein
MFDGYSVKDGKLVGIKGTVLKRRKDGIKIRGQVVGYDQIKARFPGFLLE